ncbi:MAG: S-layer homology domain-containing protein [Candidatus Aminicenantaceae bacterium]
MRKTTIVFILLLWFWSCATYQPLKPDFYLESLPQTVVTTLSLDERIATEEAWKNLREGRENKAQKILSRLDYKSPGYYVGYGYTYFALSKYQEAEESFKAALYYYPDMPLIHLGLVQLYQKTGRENLAFAEYREVLKRRPDHTWAKQGYNALKAKKTEEALEEGKGFLSQGNRERSKESFLKALYYSPDSTEAHLTLAKIYKAENNLQNAILHFEAAYSHESENPDILEDYGEALFQAEKFTKSLEVYEELLELQPGDEEIQSRIEALRNRLGIIELSSQYHNIPTREAISKEEVAALIAVKFKGILGDTKSKPPIIIDISTSWASKFILEITSLGIMDVYPSHTFQPQKIVTRAEMAEILIRLINLLKARGSRLIQQFPPEKIQISDISPDNYYHHPITQIVSYQIMDLSYDKSFLPDQPVSGQKALKILDIILNLIK